MTPRAPSFVLLDDLAAALRSKGHEVEVDAGRQSAVLKIEGQLVALANPRKNCVTLYAVVDCAGRSVRGKGVGESRVTPGSPVATVERLVAGVERRQAERARVDCVCDNQGFCHRCGRCLNADRHLPEECVRCRSSVVSAAA